MHMGDIGGLDLPISTFSCTVGLKLSQANYYIKSSSAAAALCKELSQVKDKEDYGSFEGYADGAGMHVQYAVANQQGAAKAPPHTSSASNIADLDIVMGSQFPEGSGGGGGGGGGGGSSSGRYQHLSYQGRPSRRSLTPSMNYNQVSAGWADFAEAIDSHDGDDGSGGSRDGGRGRFFPGGVGGDGGGGSGAEARGGGERRFNGRNGLSGWDFELPGSVPVGPDALSGGSSGGSGGRGGGCLGYRPGIMKHAKSAGAISGLGWQNGGGGLSLSNSAGEPRSSDIRQQAADAAAAAAAAASVAAVAQGGDKQKQQQRN
ncbi:unnamed protein product [Pylaiella littoralis]